MLALPATWAIHAAGAGRYPALGRPRVAAKSQGLGWMSSMGPVRPGPVRFRVIVVAVAALGIVGSVGWWRAMPELRVPWAAGTSVSIASGEFPHSMPLSVGTIFPCLSVPGEATIVAVGAVEPEGDIRVDAFALRANPWDQGVNAVGSIRETLAEIDGGFRLNQPAVVSAVCADGAAGGHADELAIQLSYGSGDLAGVKALLMTYRVHGVDRSTTIPFAVRFCSGRCPGSSTDSPAAARSSAGPA